MPIITVFIPGLPVPQPRQRHTKFGGNYTTRAHPVNLFKAAVQQAVAPLIVGEPWELWEGPVRLDVTFYLPRPKSKIWKNRRMVAYWHITRPDTDNLIKGVKDCLSNIVYRDDCQICDEHITKVVIGAQQQVGMQLTLRLLTDDDINTIAIE